MAQATIRNSSLCTLAVGSGASTMTVDIALLVAAGCGPEHDKDMVVLPWFNVIGAVRASSFLRLRRLLASRHWFRW
ncbi:MAG: hypothetical protein FWD59_10250, partial [Micrococcales bacterium]|nr:hypothetical protein [Micrococcales bacterium]